MKPILYSNRFNLLPIEKDDQAFIFEGLSHPKVIPFYGVSYQSLDETKQQMEFYQNLEQTGEGYWWKIVSKETGEKLGAIGFNNYQQQHKKAEIGYWLLPNFWKQGIIAEVLPVLIQYLFDIKQLHRIEALVESGNISSDKVLLQAGFIYEGLLRDYEMKQGKFISLNMYSLLQSDIKYNA